MFKNAESEKMRTILFLIKVLIKHGKLDILTSI